MLSCTAKSALLRHWHLSATIRIDLGCPPCQLQATTNATAPANAVNSAHVQWNADQAPDALGGLSIDEGGIVLVSPIHSAARCSDSSSWSMVIDLLTWSLARVICSLAIRNHNMRTPDPSVQRGDQVELC